MITILLDPATLQVSYVGLEYIKSNSNIAQTTNLIEQNTKN